MLHIVDGAYSFWVLFVGLIVVSIALGLVKLDLFRAVKHPLNMPFKPLQTYESTTYSYSTLQTARFFLGNLMGAFFTAAGWIGGFSDALKGHSVLRKYAQIILFAWGVLSSILHVQMLRERSHLNNRIGSFEILLICCLGQSIYLFFLFVWIAEVRSISPSDAHSSSRDLMMWLAGAGAACVIFTNLIRFSSLYSSGFKISVFEKLFFTPSNIVSTKKVKGKEN